MRKKLLFGLLGTVTILTITLFALIGCGGGGGPIKPPTSVGPTLSEQFLALLPTGQVGSSYSGSDICLTCHTTGANNAPIINVAGWSQTKHAQISVGCEQCHGPGANHVAAPTADNILTMPKIADSVVCGQCHGSIKSDYDASAHSGVVQDVLDSAKSNPATYVKTCFRCHSGPMRADFIDNTMNTALSQDAVNTLITTLTNTQLLTYVPVTHETATCVNCHDPMKVTGKLDEAGNEIQEIRSIYNTDTSSVAPGVPTKVYSNWDHNCGTCHNSRGGGNSDASLVSGTARPSFHDGPQFNMLQGITGSELPGTGPVQRNTSHATAPGQCTHCHMPSGKHTMLVSFDLSCAPCHTAADAAARSAVQGEIQLRLYTLRTRMENWAKAALGDVDLWNYTTLIPTGKTAPDQALVPIEVMRARHNYWFVLNDSSYGIHNAVYTRYLLDLANTNLDNIGVSRAAVVNPTHAQIMAVLNADKSACKRVGMQP